MLPAATNHFFVLLLLDISIFAASLPVNCLSLAAEAMLLLHRGGAVFTWTSVDRNNKTEFALVAVSDATTIWGALDIGLMISSSLCRVNTLSS